MTMHNTLHTGSAAHAVLSALDGRVALSGLIARGGSGPLDVRLGVMWPAGGFQVSGTSSTSPWQYSVPGATFVMSKGSLDGTHLGSNDATYLVSTIAPPASNSRYDVVYVMQQDADATINPDATTGPLIGVYNGPASATPSRSAALAAIPAGALALADALVLSTATGGTSGSGVTITQDWVWTTLRGMPIPVRNATEEAAITWGTAAEPAFTFRLDTNQRRRNSGSGWVVETGGTSVSASDPAEAVAGGTGQTLLSAGTLITLTPGTWLITAAATVHTTDVSDGVAIDIWNATTAAVVPNSRGTGAQVTTSGGVDFESRPVRLTVTANTNVQVRVNPNGASTVRLTSLATSPVAWIDAQQIG